MEIRPRVTHDEYISIERMFKKLEFYIAVGDIENHKEAFNFLKELYVDKYGDNYEEELDLNLYLLDIFCKSNIDEAFDNINSMTSEEKVEFILSLDSTYYDRLYR